MILSGTYSKWENTYANPFERNYSMQLLNTPLLDGYYVLVNIDKQQLQIDRFIQLIWLLFLKKCTFFIFYRWSNFDLPTFAFGRGKNILSTTLAKLKVAFIFRCYQFIFTMIWKNLGSHISCSCTNMYKNCHVLDKLQEGLSLDCENDG